MWDRGEALSDDELNFYYDKRLTLLKGLNRIEFEIPLYKPNHVIIIESQTPCAIEVEVETVKNTISSDYVLVENVQNNTYRLQKISSGYENWRFMVRGVFVEFKYELPLKDPGFRGNSASCLRNLFNIVALFQSIYFLACLFE